MDAPGRRKMGTSGGGGDGPRRWHLARRAFHCHADRRPPLLAEPVAPRLPREPGRKRPAFPPSAGPLEFTLQGCLIPCVPGVNRWRRAGGNGKMNRCGFGPHGYDCHRRARSPDSDRFARPATAGEVEWCAVVDPTRGIVTNPCTGAGKRPAEMDHPVPAR